LHWAIGLGERPVLSLRAACKQRKSIGFRCLFVSMPAMLGRSDGRSCPLVCANCACTDAREREGIAQTRRLESRGFCPFPRSCSRGFTWTNGAKDHVPSFFKLFPKYSLKSTPHGKISKNRSLSWRHGRRRQGNTTWRQGN
jgi:hypothetical protein